MIRPLPVQHLRKIIGWTGFMILLYFIVRAYFHRGFEKYMYITEVAVALTVMAIGVLYWTYKPQIERFTERIRIDELQKEHVKEIVNAMKIISDGYYGEYLDKTEFLIPYPYLEYKQEQRKRDFPTNSEIIELFNKTNFADEDEKQYDFVPLDKSPEGNFDQTMEHLKSYTNIKTALDNAKKAGEEFTQFMQQNQNAVYEINQKMLKLNNPESHHLYPKYKKMSDEYSNSKSMLQKSLKILVQQLEHGTTIKGKCELGY